MSTRDHMVWYVQDLIAGLDAPTAVKYLCERIQRHTNGKRGYAWASQEPLALEMSASRSKMQRAWSWGIKHKIIVSRTIRTGKRRQDTHNEYYLAVERMKSLQRTDHASPMTRGQSKKRSISKPHHASPVMHAPDDHASPVN